MEVDTEQDSFIGYRFGKEHQLEVIAWDGTRRNYIKVYTVTCHVCKQDSELHGQAVYQMAKGDILAGVHPCGCSKLPKWTVQQYLVRIKRRCAELDYTLISSPEELQHDTYLTLRCNGCEYEWGTCTLSRFLSGSGCLECKRKKISVARTKSDDEITLKFKENGQYPNVEKFWRSSRVNSRGYCNYWKYRCKICSKDEYVQAGLCTGVFESGHSHLLRGKVSCRCSTNFSWTKQQREYQIKKILSKSELHEFVGWVSEYKNNTSRLTCYCKEHGHWETAVCYVVDMQRACPDCAKFGYKRYLPAYLYVLRVGGISRDFTGYGITTSLETRMSKHKYNLAKYGLRVLESAFIEMTGEQALVIERQVKEKFPTFYQEPEGFKTEATYSHLYESVIDFVEAKLYEISEDNA